MHVTVDAVRDVRTVHVTVDAVRDVRTVNATAHVLLLVLVRAHACQCIRECY